MTFDQALALSRASFHPEVVAAARTALSVDEFIDWIGGRWAIYYTAEFQLHAERAERHKTLDDQPAAETTDHQVTQQGDTP